MGCWGACVLLTLSTVFQVVAGQNTPVIQSIRLVGVNSNSTAGRVEVQINGVFGTVCDDNWDNQDAIVVCKQLGLTGGVALTRAAFGAGSGPIHMDDVDCEGDEDTLDDCYFAFGSNNINCAHNEDAGVVCQAAGSASTPAPVPTTTPPGGVTQPDNCVSGSNQQARVRLFGPQSQPGVGYVQVRADNGTYGFVCDDGWDINAAKVVCNELCFNRSLTESSMKKEYRVSVPAPVVFALDDVQCVGTEGSLAFCQHDPWFTHDCNPTELAEVTCVIATYDTPIPPSPDLQCRNGDLIALFGKARDPNLEAKHLSLDVPCPAFTVDDSDTDYITVTIPFDDCGTNVTQNETHIVYSNTVNIEPTSTEGAISRSNQYRVVLICEMPRNGTVDKDVRPLTETVTQRAEGEFVITMTIYQDRRFSQPAVAYPFELTLGEWLNMAVELEAIDSRLKLVVVDCMASPNLTDPNAPTITLLEDKCVAERVSLEVHPLSKVKMGFRFQSFIFVNYPLVVLQCKAIVCLTSEVTAECDRSCNNSKPAVASGGSGGGASGTGSGRRRRDVISFGGVSSGVERRRRDVIPFGGVSSGFERRRRDVIPFGGVSSGFERRRRDVSEGSGSSTGSKTVYTVQSLPVVVVMKPDTGPTDQTIFPSSSLATTNSTTTTTTPTTSTSTTTTTTTTTTTPESTTTTTTAAPGKNSTTASHAVTPTAPADTRAANASTTTTATTTTTTSTTNTTDNNTNTTTTPAASTTPLPAANSSKSAATSSPTTKSATTTTTTTTTTSSTTNATTTTTSTTTTTTPTTTTSTTTTSTTTRDTIIITVRGTPSSATSTTRETPRLGSSSPPGGIEVAESSASSRMRLGSGVYSVYAVTLLPLVALVVVGLRGGHPGAWV